MTNPFDTINVLCRHIFMENKKVGWWPENVNDRNKGELIALCHSELSEDLEGVRKNKMDDHLPNRPSVEVELADTVIRIFDMCGAYGYDLGGAIQDKLEFNKNRLDHKLSERMKEDGKKF